MEGGLIKYNPKQLIAIKAITDPGKKYIKLYGGSRSGKTLLYCEYVKARALMYPGSKHFLGRYSRAKLRKTVWRQTVLPIFRPLEKSGHCRILHTETIIEFSNGSLLICDGLEPKAIAGVLATEYGTIGVTEVNENKYSIIEDLKTRMNDTARNAEGKMIEPKMIVDLNPTVKRFWTYTLWNLKLDPIDRTPLNDPEKYASVHFVPLDNIENLNPDYIQTLKNLSGGKRKRFLEGEYGSVEGLVFPIEERHIVDPVPIPKTWPRRRAIDFGFVHPFICLWSALDESNETVYFYNEWRQKNWTVRQHAGRIKAMSGNYNYRSVSDHDAGDRETLHENGVHTIPADKRVLIGIDRVNDLLDPGPEIEPRVKIFRSCSGLIDCLYTYRYIDPETVSRNVGDREVRKADDDEADAFRYALMDWFPVGSGDDDRGFGGDGSVMEKSPYGAI